MHELERAFQISLVPLCIDLSWTPRFVLPNEGISGPPAEPQWGSKYLELRCHKKRNQKNVDPQKRNVENVDPQKRLDRVCLKMWIHKK